MQSFCRKQARGRRILHFRIEPGTFGPRLEGGDENSGVAGTTLLLEKLVQTEPCERT